MKHILGNAEAILDNSISGFHQYSLQEPVHLTYVSHNLCQMLGCRQEELLNEYHDLYALMVHPADRELYYEHVRQLMQKEQTVTTQYRIIQKDGRVKYVNDTSTSGRLDDGTLVASSVLTDITSIKAEQQDLQMMNDSIPCGFLKCTCEKQPRVTYFNEQMMQILGFPDDPEEREESREMYKENIYLMIPMEQRRKFSIFLKRVYSQNSTVSGEMVVQRCDGSNARLYGWITKCINGQGEEELQAVCMDVTERYQTGKARETERYLKALTEVYDRIFEYDFSDKTVKCLYVKNPGTFSSILNIPMHMKEGTEHYIQNVVVEEDRPVVLEYFQELYRSEAMEMSATEDKDTVERPPQITFRTISSNGEIKNCSGIFIKMNSSTGLFCCNDSHQIENQQEQISEISAIKAEGVVAFEVDDDKVKPLYASDNICGFFGYTREEWDVLLKEGRSIKEFISRSGVPYNDFRRLLQQGEAEFKYTDIRTGGIRNIKAVCSHMFEDGGSGKYIMLYNIDSEVPADGQYERIVDEKPVIRIRTFGYFDVFVNENPIAFRNKKSKELLALLVDRRGGFVTSAEAISFLWEDEPVNAVTLARYRKVAMRLKNILEEYGIADMVETVDGKRRIVEERVECDLYNYLSQKEEFAHLFKGSYLTNYSWGEMTLGELVNEI